MRKITNQKFPHRAFFDRVRRLSAGQAQNKLVTAPDFDLALAIYYLSPTEKEMVLGKLPNAKADRIKQIIGRRFRFSYEQYLKIVAHLNAHLSSDRPIEKQRVYFKPHRQG